MASTQREAHGFVLVDSIPWVTLHAMLVAKRGLVVIGLILGTWRR